VEPEQAVASVSNGLRQRIEKLMHDEQLYLQPNLKISDLAQQLGSNRNYIYNAINVEMGLSFSDYVNGMRVEHAQQLMRQQPDLLLSEVAVNSGFSSTVSFYRAFKKFAGCAPKDWRP
jgi:YesN/AraC family two-component response regulator